MFYCYVSLAFITIRNVFFRDKMDVRWRVWPIRRRASITCFSLDGRKTGRCSTFSLISLSFSGHCDHLIFRALRTIFLKHNFRSLSTILFSWIQTSFVAASRARWSADSFPLTPICEVIQINTASFPLFAVFWSSLLIYLWIGLLGYMSWISHRALI